MTVVSFAMNLNTPYSAFVAGRRLLIILALHFLPGHAAAGRDVNQGLGIVVCERIHQLGITVHNCVVAHGVLVEDGLHRRHGPVPDSVLVFRDEHLTGGTNILMRAIDGAHTHTRLSRAE